MPEAPNLSADEKTLYDVVPNDGTGIGNTSLREKLGWDDAKYWATRDPLITRGLLKLGQGRGGSVRRPVAAAAPAPVAAAAPAQPAEAALWTPAAKVLEEKWSKDLLFEEFFVEVTAQQGRRNTGGTWTRPDVLVVNVLTYQNIPGKFVEVYTFEVKTHENCDVPAVYEALAHLRSATHAYVLVSVPPDKRESIKELIDDIAEEADRHGVGVILASDIANYETWEFRLEAIARQPDPAKLDEFIETQVSEANRNKLRKWIK